MFSILLLAESKESKKSFLRIDTTAGYNKKADPKCLNRL